MRRRAQLINLAGIVLFSVAVMVNAMLAGIVALAVMKDSPLKIPVADFAGLGVALVEIFIGIEIEDRRQRKEEERIRQLYANHPFIIEMRQRLDAQLAQWLHQDEPKGEDKNFIDRNGV